MITPLMITRKENAGLLRKACTDMGATPREMVGENWSLALFIKSDLKNYLHHDRYILDVAAFKEKDDEFIDLAEGILYQNDKAVIVIYADECYEGDNFLDKLIKRGITNIVANYKGEKDKDNIAKMSEDLKDALSDEGLPREKWRRFDKSYDAFAEARHFAEIAKAEEEKPKYSKAELHIAVVGAQSRIGTTTFAIHLAEYFRSRAGEAVVVCTHDKGVPQLEMMAEIYESVENAGIYTINNIDFCTRTAEPKKDYNAEIYDLGVATTGSFDFEGFDKVYLIGGTSWNELPMVYTAQLPMNKVNYTVAINFSDEAAVEKYRELLSQNLNDVIVIPFEPDAFNSMKFEQMFDNDFAEYCDKAEEEELDETK